VVPGVADRAILLGRAVVKPVPPEAVQTKTVCLDVLLPLSRALGLVHVAHHNKMITLAHSATILLAVLFPRMQRARLLS